jgi:hypothetical protein
MEIIKFFLTLRNSVKVYHWQTLSYPRHKASDSLVSKLDELADSFVEVYIGRYGHEKKGSKQHVQMSLPNLSENRVEAYLRDARDWLSEKMPEMLKKNDTELLNIRDEIIGEINQCLYLFTLS